MVPSGVLLGAAITLAGQGFMAKLNRKAAWTQRRIGKKEEADVAMMQVAVDHPFLPRVLNLESVSSYTQEARAWASRFNQAAAACMAYSDPKLYEALDAANRSNRAQVNSFEMAIRMFKAAATLSDEFVDTERLSKEEVEQEYGRRVSQAQHNVTTGHNDMLRNMAKLTDEIRLDMTREPRDFQPADIGTRPRHPRPDTVS